MEQEISCLPFIVNAFYTESAKSGMSRQKAKAPLKGKVSRRTEAWSPTAASLLGPRSAEMQCQRRDRRLVGTILSSR